MKHGGEEARVLETGWFLSPQQPHQELSVALRKSHYWMPKEKQGSSPLHTVGSVQV
jgi:hypothetical protein